jgi:hypothetical protein
MSNKRWGIRFMFFALASFAAMTLASCAESGESADDGGSSIVGSDGGSSSPPDPKICPPCVTDSDCASGSVCSQIGGDTYCAKQCPSGNECDSNHSCQAIATASGDEANVCVPNNNACGAPPQPPSSGSDAGGQPPPNTCPGLADPNTTAGCSSCSQGSKSCQPNGCYGGWWCNTQTNKCQSAPSNCNGGGGSDAGGGFDGSVQTLDGGVTSNIGSNGGSESTLYFAIIGDTRPAVIDDTSAYPTSTITKIFSDVNSLSPKPPFVVTTGDYMFASTSGSQQATQIQDYLGARKNYSGIDFPAMGNHECTGATASNCGSGNSNGITKNYTTFMTDMLGPISKTTPYYVINVSAPDNSWTAKFVFIAANAWDSTQASWLSSTLAQSTTYTFIIRHESATASTAPGVSPSESIMKQHAYTLSIVGHAHTYSHPSTKEVLFGNGGAPLTSGNYGFGLITQRQDGSIQVDAYDYSSMKADANFRFAVHPDGTPAP